MMNNLRSALALAIAMAGGAAGSAQATIWTTPILGGEMRFDDWGYVHVAPDGTVRGANDFAPINGFNGAKQIQRVVTLGPDRITPDAPQTILEDFTTTEVYYDANMDSQVNFYQWGYTTVAGSTFSNMQIDADGDYLIKRDDMSFAFYGVFDYQYAGDPNVDPTTLPLGVSDGVYNTNIAFQPYALSDAIGWCGSMMTSNPGSLEAMAGQVTFDFGFEAFFPPTTTDGGPFTPGTGSMQIVKDFIMRSYGTLEIQVSTAAGGVADLYYKADAVVNNTNPNDVAAVAADLAAGTAPTDPNWYNKVSFMGGGIVPDGVWIETVDPTAPMANTNIVAVLDDTNVTDTDGDGVDDNNPNIIWWNNSFSGYPFLLRADGIRIITDLDYSLYNDLSNVPEVNADGLIVNYDENGNPVVVQDLSAVPIPAAVWLFGSGLLGLLGVVRRKRA